jgi:hypothetical protein
LNTPTPIEAAAPPSREPRARFALSVHPGGYVGHRLGNYHFLFVADLDSAHRWESVAAVEAWLRDLPGGHARRLIGRQLFVFRVRTVAERIVAAWDLVVPIAEPEAASPKGGS